MQVDIDECVTVKLVFADSRFFRLRHALWATKVVSVKRC